MRGHRLIGVADYSRRQAMTGAALRNARLANVVRWLLR